jgi:hypothetical protein
MDTDNRRLTFTADGHAPIVFHLDRASEANNNYAMYHGWKQKLTDAAALNKDAGVDERVASIKDMAEYFEGGDVEWNRRGGGPRPFNVALLIEALANVSFKKEADPAAAATGAVTSLAAARKVDETEAAKLFASTPEVAAEMTRITRAKAPTKLSAAGLIAEITAAATAPDAPPAEEEPSGKRGKK